MHTFLLRGSRVFSTFFVLFLFSSLAIAQVQSTLQATPFYEDTTASLRAFNQPVVDSNGNVIVFGTQFGFSCGFNVCGVVIYSIAPNGTPNWIKPDTGFAAPAVNQVALGPDNTIYFQGFFSLDQVFAYSPNGSPIPNWPVTVDFPLDTGAKNLVVDPLDGSVLVKSGTSFSFSTFPGQIKAFHPDGSPKWHADFPQMPNNTPGMVVGPNDDIYTFSDQGIILHGADGSFGCSFGPQIAPLVGDTIGVFTQSGSDILRLNPDCSSTPVFTGIGQTIVLGADNGIAFAEDSAGALLGIRPDRSFWKNSKFFPDHIAVIRNSTLYVIGIDVVDNKLKLFVLDENSGDILNAFDPTGVCGGCGVAVDGKGIIYINDLGTTRIFRLTPIAAGPPSPTTSFYVTTTNASTLTSIGKDFALTQLSSGPQEAIVALLFGAPKMSGSTYGATGFRDFVSTTDIASLVEAFATGYYNALGADQSKHLRIVIATSNATAGGQVTFPHGVAWARMVNDVAAWLALQRYSGQVDIAGGSDMELSNALRKNGSRIWASAAETKDWVNGFSSVAPLHYLYDVGDAGGCPPFGNCNGQWNQDDLWFVSWGAGPSLPLPEIYTQNGSMAAQWAALSLHSVLAHGEPINVAGSLTQSQACQQRGCKPAVANSPSQGWQQLHDALQKDNRTSQELPFSSDIKWR